MADTGKENWTDYTRNLLCDPRPVDEDSIEPGSKGGDVTTLENRIATSTVEESTSVPPIIALEGPDVDPETGSFAVQSQFLINKMDTLERQFQKWYASLMLGLGKQLENVTSRIEAVHQMGLTKREHKRNEDQTQRTQQDSGTIPDVPTQQPEGTCKQSTMGSEMQPWTAWISQIKLNEQEVPEYFRTSDAMKQTVEVVEDEEVIQTTTCTPKDIDKDPEGWKLAFKAELDSFDRLDVMDSVPLNSLDTTSVEILPCKVVMVKKPLGDGTHKKKGRVVVCGNFQQVQPGEETCANTPSFPMLRTLISMAALYGWAVESWDVSTAFLYAPLIEKRDVYCKPPQVLVNWG